MDQLAVSKQQEIYEGIRSYVRLLKKQLKNVEGVEFSLRVDDVRSTVWVLKTSSYCVASIVGLQFLIEALTGYHQTFLIVTSDFFDRMASWTVGLFF